MTVVKMKGLNLSEFNLQIATSRTFRAGASSTAHQDDPCDKADTTTMKSGCYSFCAHRLIHMLPSDPPNTGTSAADSAEGSGGWGTQDHNEVPQVSDPSLHGQQNTDLAGPGGGCGPFALFLKYMEQRWMV